MHAPLPLLAISERHVLRDDLLSWLQSLGEFGVSAVQLREKDLPDSARLALARAARRVLPSTTRLLVNGRIDLALAAAADGVHLPAGEVSATRLHRCFGEGLLLGRSAHSVSEVEAARRDGADYVTFGPVFATPSKLSYGPPLGLKALEAACRLPIPVLALGGVQVADFPRLAACGASGVAGVRLVAHRDLLADVVAAAKEVFRG